MRAAGLRPTASAQNAAISKYFEEKYDQSLARALGQTFTGDVLNSLLALVQGPHEWYAARLKSALKAAFKGFGNFIGPTRTFYR